MISKYDVVIIGGGASGLMCAGFAAERGQNVLVLEHTDSIAQKIRVSGGGRCNFTNLSVGNSNYSSKNSDFAISALKRYSSRDFVQFLEKNGIKYEEKKDGQLFCVDGAQKIVNALETKCSQSGVVIKTHCKIKSVAKDTNFKIDTDGGHYSAQSLVIATGGLSMPSLGATDFGYEIAKQFGLKVVETAPALVPLKGCHKEFEHYSKLSGVSLDVSITCKDETVRDDLLFTHSGLSGPAILKVSNHWKKQDKLVIDLLPNINLSEEIVKLQKERPKQELKTVLATLLPKRVVKEFCPHHQSAKALAHLSQKEIKQVANIFHEWVFIPIGTAGYHKAEVTKGGVDTAELSSKTFESNSVSGLYFIGEVVDVTGTLGGYNFQWAWSSGYCCAQSL